MNNIPKGFFDAKPGQRVRSGDKIYRITHLVTVSTVFALNEETQESERLEIDKLEAVADGEATAAPRSQDLQLYSHEDWAVAQQRFQAIKSLLDKPLRTRVDAERISAEQGVHVGTLYKWLSAYQKAGHVSALVPTKRGRRSGVRLLTDAQEKLVDEVLDEEFLSKQRKLPAHVIEEVQRRARLSKIKAPHPNTIRNRIKMLPVAETLIRRGQKDVARNLYEPVLGEFPIGDYPLHVVQIDHTKADIMLVDEIYRKPIERPWVTLAIDVYTRMVVGLYVSFENPSSTSVAMCIAHAMCPKREYLADLDVSGEWPVWGAMTIVHVDNGKEFRGQALERGCGEYGIDLQWRPPLRPHYGGHIERLMGTMANQIHQWPGTTFSNIAQRKGYNSEKEAALTLREFQYLLVEFFVNVYHQRNHSQLDMPPRRKWELGVLGDAKTPGTGIPPVPSNPGKLVLDFMPFVMRSVQQYGIQIDLINYYDPVLKPYINSVDPENPKNRREFIVKRDPRDISKVYFFDPIEMAYYPIAYANMGHPAMSLWELNEIKRQLKAEGKAHVDEDVIFEALGRMRALIEAAQKSTKSARVKAARQPPQKKTTPTPGKPVGEEAADQNTTPSRPMSPLEDDLFAQPVTPFDDVSLSR